MNLRGPILLLASIVACSSASAPSEVVVQCPSVSWTALAVNVRDSQTGRAAARGGTLYSTLRLSSETHFDTSRVVTPDSLTMYAGHVPGTYDLRLTVPGYADWSKNNIVVPSHSSGCGPVFTTIEASVRRLQ